MRATIASMKHLKYALRGIFYDWNYFLVSLSASLNNHFETVGDVETTASGETQRQAYCFKENRIYVMDIQINIFQKFKILQTGQRVLLQFICINSLKEIVEIDKQNIFVLHC